MKRSGTSDIANLWQKKRQARRSVSVGAINLAPMMDVMFNLLIFFLVATSFQMPEGLLSARLPKTSGISDRQAIVPVVPIKIFLETAPGEKNVLIRVSTSMSSDAASLIILEDFDQLYTLLKTLPKKPGITNQTPVIIASKDKVKWDTIVNAYNAAVRAKFKNIVFAEF